MGFHAFPSWQRTDCLLQGIEHNVQMVWNEYAQWEEICRNRFWTIKLCPAQSDSRKHFGKIIEPIRKQTRRVDNG
eukprot:4188449-Pyramimonas_sp.AAC.1